MEVDTKMKGKLKKGITLLVPAKNEELRLEAFLKQFKPYVYAIIVVENGSTDRTVEIAEKYADKVVQPKKIECIHNRENWEGLDKIEVHPCTVYNEGLKLVETEYILTADCDEVWDEGFLKNMKKIIAEKPDAICFRFPRCNLPDGEDFPDYQVRLVKTRWVSWKHNPHVVPYFRGAEKRTGKLMEVPLDFGGATETLDDYPIIHSPRRKDIKRPWWGLKL